MSEHEFTAILETLQSQQDLTSGQIRTVVNWFLSGEAAHADMKRFLEHLADKGETVDELVGAAQALRDSMVPLANPHPVAVDTCGTGGDGSKTFNISTAAALVAAAAGVPVAKHGNRKVTSQTGSADVLGELGINLEAQPAQVQRCLAEIGICFCFAPYFHPAMRHVGPVRREIPRPTIFNRLGPLANPAGVPCQVLGVGAAELQDALASALHQLGTQRSIVVRGEDGVDEISLSAPTRVLEVSPGGITEHRWTPADFGIQQRGREELFADSPAASAECIREVLDDRAGAKRDVVVLNAAAALWVAGQASDLKECTSRASQAISSGQAKKIVADLARLSTENG